MDSSDIAVNVPIRSVANRNCRIASVLSPLSRESREPQDHEWMYGRSFEDINGHLWEIIYMDERTIKNGEKHS
jgi:predicted lactoylglutathione lyase